MFKLSNFFLSSCAGPKYLSLISLREVSLIFCSKFEASMKHMSSWHFIFANFLLSIFSMTALCSETFFISFEKIYFSRSRICSVCYFCSS